MALAVKNLPASAEDIRDAGSIPELGRSPGEGNGNLLQYSCLENPMDNWQAIVHKAAQSWTWLKRLSMNVCICYVLCVHVHMHVYVCTFGSIMILILSSNHCDYPENKIQTSHSGSRKPSMLCLLTYILPLTHTFLTCHLPSVPQTSGVFSLRTSTLPVSCTWILSSLICVLPDLQSSIFIQIPQANLSQPALQSDHSASCHIP